MAYVEAPSLPNQPTPPLNQFPPVAPEPSHNRRQLVIVIVVLVLLLAGGVAAYMGSRLLKPAGTDPTPTPEIAASPNLPTLNMMGTSNAARPEHALLQTAAQNPATFADLNNTMSAEELYGRLKDRLGLKSEDSDNDGLSDLAEIFIYGTNPFYHDSDFDGQTDTAEIAANTNAIGDDSMWTAELQGAVNSRKDYWKTDFALGADRQQQSDRDFTRVNQAGKIAVMIQMYYQKNNKYPVATAWQGAVDELIKTNTGAIFGITAATALQDPLNQAPYVYEYTSTGLEYTFAYSLEGSKKKLSQTGTNGTAGNVVETPLAVAAEGVKTSWMPDLNVQALVKKFVPEAHALRALVGTARTLDGQSVDVYGDPVWITAVRQLTFQQLLNYFVDAARHGEGYCDSGACYCSNGVTIAFGTNHSSCSNLTVPATVVAGQQFQVSVDMQNAGQRFWNIDDTPHGLGFQNPQDNTRWGIGRVALPGSPLAVGQKASFSFTATAPATLGTYPFAVKMVEDGREWFGQTCEQAITVVSAPTPGPSTPTPPTNNTGGASGGNNNGGSGGATGGNASVTPSASASASPSTSAKPSVSSAPTPTFSPGDFKETD